MKDKLETILTGLLWENKQLQEFVSSLEESIIGLSGINNSLLEEKNSLLEEKNHLLDEKHNLLAENQQLKERLKLNSTNSSLPPSKDITRTKNKNRTASDKKPGGQPGHTPHHYQFLVADQVVKLIPNVCKCCGEPVKVSDHFTREQKIELPPIKPYITEYRRFHGRCVYCTRRVVASLPEGVGKDLLGPGAKAIITALNGFFHNSKREVQEILKEIFHLPISLGLTCETAKRVKEELASSYEKIETTIKTSHHLHIDETGHRSKGKRGWTWMFSNQEASLVKLTFSRGKQVLIDTLGKYTGYVVSDRYGVYNHFSEEKRQLCWSHLLRDYERLAQSSNVELSDQGRRLVVIAKEVFSLQKALNKQKIIEEPYFLRRINKLKKEIKGLFKHILKIPDIPAAHGVIKRMLGSFKMMWLFITEKGIAMTNNLAERQIRKYVLYRKKLLFTWSGWGNQYVERTLSMYLTCRPDRPAEPRQTVGDPFRGPPLAV